MNSWATAHRAFGTDAGSGVIVPSPCGDQLAFTTLLQPRRFITALSSVPAALSLDLTPPAPSRGHPVPPTDGRLFGTEAGAPRPAIIIPAACESVRAPHAQRRGGGEVHHLGDATSAMRLRDPQPAPPAPSSPPRKDRSLSPSPPHFPPLFSISTSLDLARRSPTRIISLSLLFSSTTAFRYARHSSVSFCHSANFSEGTL